MDKKEVIAKITEYLKDLPKDDLEAILIIAEGLHRKNVRAREDT